MNWIQNLMLVSTAGLVLIGMPAAADCMQDIYGNVLCGKGDCQRNQRGVIRCSAFRHGGAVLTRYGEILCGKGDCVTTSKGKVFCSTVEEGGALIDIRGVPRCEGQCEAASTDYCEATTAGTVGE